MFVGDNFRLNFNMSLQEFKKIFYMEWAHRFLGRGIGFVFALPFAYFLARGSISKSLRVPSSLLILVLIKIESTIGVLWDGWSSRCNWMVDGKEWVRRGSRSSTSQSLQVR